MGQKHLVFNYSQISAEGGTVATRIAEEVFPIRFLIAQPNTKILRPSSETEGIAQKLNVSLREKCRHP